MRRVLHYGFAGLTQPVNQPDQTADWGSKFKRWRLAKAVRLIKELERWRGLPVADAVRFAMVRLQPGLAPLTRRRKPALEFSLWLPPGWVVSAHQQRRLQRLLQQRQQRTGAAVVSCDDWVPLLGGRRAWRQKGQYDHFADKALQEFEGPLWICSDLLAHLGEPPVSVDQRVTWRRLLFSVVGGHGWAHVALPLLNAPNQEFAQAQPATPQGHPLVSVLIPSAGFHKPIAGRPTMLVRHCLQTLLQRSEYRELEIVLIDGGELSTELIAEFSDFTTAALGPGRWRHQRSSRPYSYSERMNQASAAARGDWLLQLNDDTELLQPSSIGSMLALAQNPEVGVVGSLLLYPNGRVQHAGVAIDNAAPRHAWVGYWPHRLPQGLLSAPRQFQAVTAAVSLCSARLWRELGGLSHELPVNYGDIDFCLRARQRGLAVILDPASCWSHFESASRDTSGVPPELSRFRDLWMESLGGRWCTDPYTSRWRELMGDRS